MKKKTCIAKKMLTAASLILGAVCLTGCGGGSHESDVKAITEIIKTQNEAGANIPEDLTDHCYKWNDDGRLAEILWENVGLTGFIAFDGLSALEYIDCSENNLS